MDAVNAQGAPALDHIGIVVHDLEAAKRFYVEALGCRLVHQAHLTDRGIEVVKLCLHTTHIELMAARDTNSEISCFVAKRGEGMHHVCLRTHDLGALLARAKALGARVVKQGGGHEVAAGADGRPVAFLHPKDTCGVLIEWVEDASQRPRPV